MRSTLNVLRKKLAAGRKISMLTCYDAGFAKVMEDAEVDSILVGDTLGMLVQGRDSTLAVQLQDIAYHVSCVARGSQRPFLVADMPFGTYQESPRQALRNAVVLMQAGAQMVKIEGGAELVPTIELLTRSGIPVCGHIGLLPSHVHALGGYRVQGKEEAEARRIVADARAVEAAGAAMMVIEAVPDPVARQVCEAVGLITIGIGASVACSGQVLVMHDMLGLTATPAKFVKNYMAGASAGGDAVLQAFRRYAREVETGAFPAAEHVYGMTAGTIGTPYGNQSGS